MNSQASGLKVAAVLFAIFAIAHLVRILTHLRVIIGGREVPLPVSWFALILASLLSAWLWRLSSARR